MRYIFSLAVWKTCLPWDMFKKTIMRAVHNLQTWPLLIPYLEDDISGKIHK